MKVRIGFVSNSSSSSFVCDVCGEHAEGWDGPRTILLNVSNVLTSGTLASVSRPDSFRVALSDQEHN